MRIPVLNWACGILAVLGLPLGLIIALTSGSFLKGLGSMIIAVFIAMLACRKDILREYHQKDKSSTKEPSG